MKENTQEKKLIKKSENNRIINIIKNFFNKLFNKQKNSGEKELIKCEDTHNNLKFKENIKVQELNEERLLELQLRYRNGDINEYELTNEEIDKLSALYDVQIRELEEQIEAKRITIEEYRKRKKYGIKKNNA